MTNYTLLFVRQRVKCILKKQQIRIFSESRRNMQYDLSPVDIMYDWGALRIQRLKMKISLTYKFVIVPRFFIGVVWAFRLMQLFHWKFLENEIHSYKKSRFISSIEIHSYKKPRFISWKSAQLNYLIPLLRKLVPIFIIDVAMEARI